MVKRDGESGSRGDWESRSQSVVGGDVLTTPDLLRGPVLRGIAPKGIASRQTEREEHCGAEVETARRNISFGDARLTTVEANLEPAFGSERPRSLDHTPDNRGQRGSHLFRQQAL